MTNHQPHRPLVPRDTMSPRQRQVVHARYRGQSLAEIAAAIGVSESTVGTHMHDARRRYGAKSDDELFATMIERGWLLTPPRRKAAEYSTWLRATVDDVSWQPSPAQRLYLTAFDRFLHGRNIEVSAAAMDLAMRLMCWEGRTAVPVATFRVQDAADRRDAMLLGIARGLLRPIPV